MKFLSLLLIMAVLGCAKIEYAKKTKTVIENCTVIVDESENTLVTCPDGSSNLVEPVIVTIPSTCEPVPTASPVPTPVPCSKVKKHKKCNKKEHKNEQD